MPTTWRSRLLAVLAVAVAALGLFFGMRALSDRDATPSAGPSPTVSSPSSPSPSPSPAPTETVEQPKPFKVRLLSAAGEALDSSNMYARQPKPAPHNIRRSSRRAALALQRYLNGQFVGPRTRQTVAPMRALLTNDARKLLGPRDRRALGLGMRRIVGGKTVRANARARVLYRGMNAYAVTLRYTAIMDLVLAGDRAHRMSQAGIMVMRPTQRGPWRAEMVDVTLRMRPPRQPKPRPSSSEPGPTDSASEGGTS